MSMLLHGVKDSRFKIYHCDLLTNVLLLAVYDCGELTLDYR